MDMNFYEILHIAENAPDEIIKLAGGVSKSMLKQSRLNFDKIEKCE